MSAPSLFALPFNGGVGLAVPCVRVLPARINRYYSSTSITAYSGHNLNLGCILSCGLRARATLGYLEKKKCPQVMCVHTTAHIMTTRSLSRWRSRKYYVTTYNVWLCCMSKTQKASTPPRPSEDAARRIEHFWRQWSQNTSRRCNNEK